MKQYGAEFIGTGVEQIIKRRTRRVVGVGRHRGAGERHETKIYPLLFVQREGDAGLVLANGGGALLNAEFAQHRNDRGNERFADNEFRPPAVVEERDFDALHREQRRKRGTRRAAADYADGFDVCFNNIDKNSG